MTEELTLNISSAPIQLTKKHSRRGFIGKISKHRKQRILDRRKYRKKIEKFGVPLSEETKTTNEEKDVTKTAEKNVKTERFADGSSPLTKTVQIKKRPPKPVTANIFSGNPDIPELDLPKPKVQTKTEKETTESFSDLDIHSGLKSYIIDKMNLKEMTAVQSRSLPILLKGKDALIKSQTGSGKTLAYALSIMQSLQTIEPEVNRETGPLAIVLTPTRELAQQSYAVFQQVTQPIRRIVATWLVGGQNRKSEKARIRKGTNIIVSTPGRFLDHLENTACLSLEKIKWVVFDEADRLLDMGFQKDIKRILAEVKKQATGEHQTVLLSATLNKGVESLVDLAMSDPVTIDVNDVAIAKSESGKFVDPATGLYVEKTTLPEQLQQHVVIIPTKLRLVSYLAFIAAKHKSTKVLVFLSCRDSVQFHYQLTQKFLGENFSEDCRSKVLQLHGGMAQVERTKMVLKFKKLTSSILLCTDVAARGLDIPCVDWVLQYTSPGNPVDYIHRVGRTARAGHKGNALLFLTPVEAPYVKLLSSYEIAIHSMKLDDLLSDLLDQKSQKLHYNIRIQMAKEKASETHKMLESYVKESKNLRECAIKAFVAYIRAYATYPSALKHIFHVKNLHIGHVAKSFALQDTPSEALASLHKTIGQNAVRQMQFKRKRKMDTSQAETSELEEKQEKRDSPVKKHPVKTFKIDPKKKHPILARFDLMSEFSSGL